MTGSLGNQARASQEPDLKSGSWLLRLTLGAVGVAALAVLFSWWLARDATSGPARRPFNGSDANALERAPIETSERGMALRKAQTARLSQFGWVDRDAGIVRIPIERALEMRLQEQR